MLRPCLLCHAVHQSRNSTVQTSHCTGLKDKGGASCAKISMPMWRIQTSARLPAMLCTHLRCCALQTSRCNVLQVALHMRMQAGLRVRSM